MGRAMNFNTFGTGLGYSPLQILMRIRSVLDDSYVTVNVTTFCGHKYRRTLFLVSTMLTGIAKWYARMNHLTRY